MTKLSGYYGGGFYINNVQVRTAVAVVAGRCPRVKVKGVRQGRWAGAPLGTEHGGTPLAQLGRTTFEVPARSSCSGSCLHTHLPDSA